ncbi:hemolysin family protein [Candidatus Woesearchaeota archaeon]|nr:hemolysin family protein [Candidatus Woesearchaeota archaeon]
MMFYIISAIILLLLSAFFSGSETAIVSLTKIQLEDIKKNKKPGYKSLVELKEHPKKTLITILIGNNLVNIWLSSLATMIAIDLFQSNTIGIVVGLITLLILIFGEIIPKNMCFVYNERVSLFVARYLVLLQYILLPVIKFLQIVNHIVFKIFRISEPDEIITEEEIRTAASLGTKHGTIDKHSAKIIHEVIDFNNTKVEEIMTPASEIFSLNGNLSLMDVMNEIVENGYSRIPIYERKITNCIGILHVSEMLKYVAENKPKIKLKDLKLNPIFYVPETKKIGELLKSFQEKRTHLAFVVDEYGNIEGIVTLEDVLEELVGDIFDESDIDENFIEKVSSKEYIVNSMITLDLLKKKLRINLKSEESNTLNGYILEKFGEVPRTDKKFKIGKKEFTILSRAKTRVKKVRIKL